MSFHVGSPLDLHRSSRFRPDNPVGLHTDGGDLKTVVTTTIPRMPLTARHRVHEVA